MQADIKRLTEDYEKYLRMSFDEIWSQVRVEADKLEAYSVIGGLLARQVTLSLEMARSPGTWNGHSAPLFLRAMTDLYIALAWILGDLKIRAEKYIKHGLGEEKLLMELYKQKRDELTPGEQKTQMEKVVELKENWINFQRREFFVEVNLGNWAPLNYRQMAEESECLDLYNFAYKPFSHAAHNMWPHVSVYNSQICPNPLHRNHLIPSLSDVPIDADYLYRSIKYVDKAYHLFVDKLNLPGLPSYPIDWWEAYIDEINTTRPENH
ncbi:DUF5677 domain-containing protein [Massilia varians]|uniref:DUF5677 domain-containing protein n=1 Tax=Massilia varians TaxID=457921 RepID=UPI0025557973|nr:DUF5677 domain-containing protein [Massilia varians]MDK6080023.1 DUF5677 domain-containing protein [Massilia varians]